MIDNLKKYLSMFFDMKKLGPTQHILEIKIIHDRKSRKYILLQEYVKCVIKRFNMEKSQAHWYALGKSLQVEQEKFSLFQERKRIDEDSPLFLGRRKSYVCDGVCNTKYCS